MARGRIYEVDMRLRPSGRQGPVATSFESFCAYQRDEAWTWEHLALTRARPIVGGSDLVADIEAFRAEILAEKSAGQAVRTDTAEMRSRLRAAKPGQGDLDAKDGVGRLQDIELLAQMLTLKAASTTRRSEAQILAGRRAGLIDADQEASLLTAYRLLWRVQSAMRLLADRVTEAQALGEGAQAFVLRETGLADLTALTQRLDEVTKAAAQVIDALLPANAPD